MGIPAAFRWLSTKYPKIISPVLEDQPVTMPDGTVIPVDATRPNPNKEEFDNLYLDMNGIVHPCSHPEDKPAPTDEEEMMAEIFKYTDRVVNMVRPRKLLMIAVDGVAPRAKMNQQRSRRFRAAQEAQEKEDGKQELIKVLKKQNGGLLKVESAEAVVKKAFDSNSITPGTPFMDILAGSLRYWCAYKLNTDPAWAKMKVIISDATVPGEGEHKIMEFVRSQRNSPDHDPNTRHVIYGLDADLIMLGLATHEPHFRVLREDVFFQDSKAKMCRLCGQKGHDASQCKGEAKEKDGESDEKDKAHPLKPFIWLHVAILREYLAAELDVPGLPFRFDLERAIDDWVFMCFFVGNDFLPHLPALEIRENGIDTLTAIWKDNLPHMGGYVTKDGHVDLERAQYIMNGLAKQEDAIFRRRKETEDRREAGFKRRRLQQQGNGRDSPHAKAAALIQGVQAVTHDMVVNRQAVDQANVANKSAASVLKSQIQTLLGKSAANGSSKDGGGVDDAGNASTLPAASAPGKRKASEMEENGSGTGTPSNSNNNNNNNNNNNSNSNDSSEEGPVDTVKLWEEGYADRYYEQKFHVDPRDVEFRHKVARAYTEGLAWVLMYYFQGCPSWEWFYPYHYAPFAADFVDLGKMKIKFEKGRISRPFEQLMSVLPAASRHAIPEVFHDLMTNEDSTIIDFYPEDFEVDLNGKKMAWQGVALLPFIDMPRLLTAMDTRYPLLSATDKARNEMGKDVLLLSDSHPTLYDDVTLHFYSKKQGASKHKLVPQVSDGLSGKITKIEGYLPHGSLPYPLSRNSMPDVEYDRSLRVHYEFPGSSHQHKSMLLRGVKLPPAALDRTDIEVVKGKAQRSGRSYGGVPLNGRGRGGGYQGHGGDRGGGRGPPINYGPGNGRSDRGSYDYRQHQPPPPARHHDGYGNGAYGQPSPAPYFPPPPGQGRYGYSGGGAPPPQPPAGYGGAGYGGGHYGGGHYGGDNYGARQQQYAQPPPPGTYGGHHYQGQQYRAPPPPGIGPGNGQDRQYGGRASYDGRTRGHRDSGGGYR